MGLLDRLGDGSKAFLNEVLKPESLVKGDKFEAYIRNPEAIIPVTLT